MSVPETAAPPAHSLQCLEVWGAVPWPEAWLENLAGPFWSRLNRRWSPGRPLDVGDERGSDEGKTGLY